MQTIRMLCTGAFDSFGHTYSNYVFTIKKEICENPMLLSLTKDEIKKLSWNKLLEWNKLSEARPKSCRIILMPNDFVKDIGIIASENIMNTYTTETDITNAYNKLQEHNEYVNKNSCNICGRLNCSDKNNCCHGGDVPPPERVKKSF
jgi:hypothetical protein